MTTLLEVDNLGVRFNTPTSIVASLARGKRHVDVLVDVSFSVRRGETLAVVGESGSGKTTLGRALIGLLPVHKGRIAFQGEDVTHQAGPALERRARGMSMMFQDPVASLSPRLNVLKLVTEPFAIHRIDPPGGETPQQAGLRLLSQVGLNEHFARRFPHELSGGQARRVGVARALALRPDMIIADEPTAGLDVSIQGATLNLLTGLQREFGLALLLVTHNLAVVRHVADRVAVMYMGRIVELGTTRQILEAPQHPYTRFLVAAQPRLGVPIEETHILEGEVPSLLNRGSGCDFRGRCPLARELCRDVPPPATTMKGGSTVLCHLAGEAVDAA
ncbi:MAG: ABC transporter ATP-binding protein [Rhizobiaceae bacterium]|nr:ABC transporter ATP-binding protein [Rhizobiaceae bacterium]